MVCKALVDATIEGAQVSKARSAEKAAESERIAKETEKNPAQEEKAKVQRRMRERRSTKPGGNKPSEAGKTDAK